MKKAVAGRRRLFFLSLIQAPGKSVFSKCPEIHCKRQKISKCNDGAGEIVIAEGRNKQVQ